MRVLLHAKMLKETKTEETIVFFVTFLSLVAFQLGRAWPPWLRQWVSTMPTAEAATVKRAVHVGSVVIALSCSPVSRLFHENLQLYTLFLFFGWL